MFREYLASETASNFETIINIEMFREYLASELYGYI